MKLKFCSRDYDGKINWVLTILLYMIFMLFLFLIFAIFMAVREGKQRSEFIRNVPAGYHVEYVPRQGLMPLAAGKTVILVPHTYWDPIYVKERRLWKRGRDSPTASSRLF